MSHGKHLDYIPAVAHEFTREEYGEMVEPVDSKADTADEHTDAPSDLPGKTGKNFTIDFEMIGRLGGS